MQLNKMCNIEQTLCYDVKMYFFDRRKFPLCSFIIVTRQNIVACIMHNLFFNSTDEQSVLLPQLKMLDNISMFFGKVQGNMPWAYVFVCRVIC